MITPYEVLWSGSMDRQGTCFSLLGDRRSESSLGPHRTRSLGSSDGWVPLTSEAKRAQVHETAVLNRSRKAKQELEEQGR